MPRTLLNVHVCCLILPICILTIPNLMLFILVAKNSLQLLKLMTNLNHPNLTSMLMINLTSPFHCYSYVWAHYLQLHEMGHGTQCVQTLKQVCQIFAYLNIFLPELFMPRTLLNVPDNCSLKLLLNLTNSASTPMPTMTCATYLMSDDLDLVSLMSGLALLSRHDTRYDMWGLALVMSGLKNRYIIQIIISSMLNVSFYYDPTLLDADPMSLLLKLSTDVMLILYLAIYPDVDLASHDDVGCDHLDADVSILVSCLMLLLCGLPRPGMSKDMTHFYGVPHWTCLVTNEGTKMQIFLLRSTLIPVPFYGPNLLDVRATDQCQYKCAVSGVTPSMHDVFTQWSGVIKIRKKCVKFYFKFSVITVCQKSAKRKCQEAPKLRKMKMAVKFCTFLSLSCLISCLLWGGVCRNNAICDITAFTQTNQISIFSQLIFLQT